MARSPSGTTRVALLARTGEAGRSSTRLARAKAWRSTRPGGAQTPRGGASRVPGSASRRRLRTRWGKPATMGSDGNSVAWVTREALPHPAQRGTPVSASRTTSGGVMSVQTDVGVPSGVLPIPDDALLIRGSEAIELWRGHERVQRLPSTAGTTLGLDGGAAWVGVGASRLRPALIWHDIGGSWVATQGADAIRIGRGCPDAPLPWPKGSCGGARPGGSRWARLCSGDPRRHARGAHGRLRTSMSPVRHATRRLSEDRLGASPPRP